MGSFNFLKNQKGSEFVFFACFLFWEKIMGGKRRVILGRKWKQAKIPNSEPFGLGVKYGKIGG